MPNFDYYFVPGVSASSDASDDEIGLATVLYSGTLEPDWANVGTNSRLTAVDSSVVSWNTAAAGTSSRLLTLSGWTQEGTGSALSDLIRSNATIGGFAMTIKGSIVVSSLDSTSCDIYAGLRQQAVGGVVTGPAGGPGGAPQLLDEASLINNGGAGAGTYAIDGEVGTLDALGGLSQSDALALLRSSTLLLKMFILNGLSSTFTLNLDQIRLRVIGSNPSSGVGRTIVQLPGGVIGAARSRTRGRFSL